MKKRVSNYLIVTLLLVFSIIYIPANALAGVPSILSVDIDYNDGASPALVITWDEAVETTSVDETKFHLRDATGVGPDIITTPAETGVVGAAVNFDLTESQRVALLAQSGVAGGDGGAVVLDVDANAARSLSTLEYNIADNNNAATETADTNRPTVTSATLNYNDNNRQLVVTFSETTDASATDQTLFHINNTTGTDVVTLTNPTASPDGTTLTFTLTEAQRVAALAISGTPGGDGGAVVLDVDAEAISDMGTNTNLIDDNNAVAETADTNRPTVTSATLNYNDNNRQLVVTFSETVDASAADQTLFHINNVTDTDVVTLADATASPDGTTLTFILTEAQRVAALAISGAAPPVGDGGAVVLDVDAGGVTDMGTNTSLIDDNNPVAETADTNNPAILSWSLDLSAPSITVNFSETVDVSTRDLTAVTIQDAATATSSHTLTTSTTASGDGTSIVIDLSVADKTGIRAFAVDINTSYLRTTNLLIDDMAGNGNNAIADGSAMQASAYAGSTAASASNTTVVASPSRVITGGAVSIIVTPKDAGGANLGTGEPVSLSTTFGSLLGSVSDRGDGTYGQSLTSSVVGNATVTATVGGVVIDQRAVVVFYSIPSVSTSTTTLVSTSTTTSVSPSTSTISSTSTVSPSSTTTSASLSWPMAYDKMWGARKDKNLLLMRVFRDEILLNTEVGREYIFMLYDNSLEIATLLLQESSLTVQTREVIDELLTKVESLLYNDEIKISQDTIDNFVSLLDNFESNASPKLRTVIRELKRDIYKREIFEQFEVIISE